ncbi:GNAT family N-acetyltransferase [Candidatus Entotheonella palauensis]|uniref:GNAT family N-acetyltransferase n=1 Tax=Candidatus Entotheonella palauensis TaxID=93172 RepID=UPI0034E0187E
MLHPHFREWIGDVVQCQPFFALIRDGCAVSVCGSVRKTSQAHEAGVETAQDFRGRGYAAAVVSAWAHAVRQIGLIPLYSTSWQNMASQAVARKLGLVPYGTDLHMT